MEKVFITGASSGIGAELARQYSRKGASVFLFARREERLIALKKEFNSANPESQVDFFVGDVTCEEDLKKAFSICENQFGGLDILIANAGFGVSGNFENLTSADFKRQVDVNVMGVIHTIYPAIEMLKKNKGTVAVLGSANSYLSLPSTSAYCMSKFAVRGLTEALYAEFGVFDVHVALICPGFVESEIRQVNKDGVYKSEVPEQIPKIMLVPTSVAARVIVSGIKNKKREIVVSVHAKLSILLVRHFPGLIYSIIKNGYKRAQTKVLEKINRLNSPS